MSIEPRNPYASQAIVPLTGFAYYLDHFYGLPGVLRHKFAVVMTLALRSARMLLILAGVPLHKPVLVLGCPAEENDAGFFAEFGSVLGMLEHYDRCKFLYAGAAVDFGSGGFYFDSAHGANWWEYYFEPLGAQPHGATSSRDVRSPRPGTRMLTRRERDVLAQRAENRLSRSKGHALIARYVRVRREIIAKVDAFAGANFTGRHVIGVHYRGTDKIREAPRVSYEAARASVEVQIGRARAGTARIFVATDEEAFLDYFRGVFPQMVCAFDALRSLDGRRLHDGAGNNHRKGEDALIDCLLLSRCDQLVRTESNLGLCAAFFNPDVPQILLRSA